MDIAKDRADWLLDAVACATQDRRFLRGEPEYDAVSGEAILLNAEKAISVAIAALRADNAEYAEMFDLIFSADQRAVEQWRAKNPGNDLVIPDKGKTVTWLLEQLDALRAENARLREALAIAGPIALKDFANHTFVLNEEERRQVAVIRAALEASHEA